VVNIRADEIVDGNPKLTLGLIWTLILHYQVSDLSTAYQAQLEHERRQITTRAPPV